MGERAGDVVPLAWLGRYGPDAEECVGCGVGGAVEVVHEVFGGAGEGERGAELVVGLGGGEEGGGEEAGGRRLVLSFVSWVRVGVGFDLLSCDDGGRVAAFQFVFVVSSVESMGRIWGLVVEWSCLSWKSEGEKERWEDEKHG